jgi:hypothetical protein
MHSTIAGKAVDRSLGSVLGGHTLALPKEVIVSAEPCGEPLLIDLTSHTFYHQS